MALQKYKLLAAFDLFEEIYIKGSVVVFVQLDHSIKSINFFTNYYLRFVFHHRRCGVLSKEPMAK
jgi:hypothetical protein